MHNNNNNIIIIGLTTNCSLCHKTVPKMNITTHEAACHKIQTSKETSPPQPLATSTQPLATPKQDTQPLAAPKQDTSINSKPKPKKKPAAKLETMEDDLDHLLAEVTLKHSTCGFAKCKRKVSVLGFLCQFCRKKFCTEHSIPETHGCGEEAKRHARSKQGMDYLHQQHNNHYYTYNFSHNN